MDENYILFVIWLVFLVVYLFLSRSNLLNKPENVLVDYGEHVIARTNKLTMLFGANRIKLVKSQIVKVQRTETSYISFIKVDKSVTSLWVPKRFIDNTFERAKMLFPEAKIVDLNTEV